MRRLIYIIVILFIISEIKVLGQNANKPYKNLTVLDFKSQIAKGKNIIVLDVRTPEEFAKGFILGAININYFDTNFKERVEKLSATKPIYVYCAVGGRSAKASALIASLNRKEIYNLEGGFTVWQKFNYPIRKQ